MICTECGGQNPNDAIYCNKCGVHLNTPELMLPPSRLAESFHLTESDTTPDATPDGIKGWSWGAFFLNWIWAIGNRTWWGLLALIPYVGLIVAIWLGFKGREMAWRNRRWDDLEHFNRIQKRWSQWGVGIFLVAALIGAIAFAISLRAYQDYTTKAKTINLPTKNLDYPNTEALHQVPTKDLRPNVVAEADQNLQYEDELWRTKLQAHAETVNKNAPITVTKDIRLDTSQAHPGRKITYHFTSTSLSFDQFNESIFKSNLNELIRRLCRNDAMNELLNNKTKIVFHFKDMNENFIKEIEVHASDCAISTD